MKITTLASIVVVALSLTGCATKQDRRVIHALFDVSSSKASHVVAACITEKWKGTGIFGMSMNIKNAVQADGYEVSVKNGQVVQMLADVRDSGTGSVSTLYKPGYVAARDKFEAAVRNCQ